MKNFKPTESQLVKCRRGVDSTNVSMSNKKLTPILLLQMDNCVGDNKNIYAFSFLSLLIAKRVFDIR